VGEFVVTRIIEVHSLLAIIGLVGLILGILPPVTITRLIGEKDSLLAAATAAVLGVGFCYSSSDNLPIFAIH